MNSFDESLKYLVEQRPADFIGFGLGTSQPMEVLQPLPLTMPSRKRDLDGGYLVQLGSERRVMHLEYHRRHQALEDLALDVAEAQIRLYRREKLPVMTQVWDLYGSRTGPLLEDRVLEYGLAMEAMAGSSKCQSIYRRVNLRAETWRHLLSRQAPGLWSLMPLTSDGANEEAVRCTRDAIEGRTDLLPGQKSDHLAILAFMGEAEGLPEQMMRAYISESQMMESSLYRSIFSKGKAKGEAEGEARGRAEALLRLMMRQHGYLDETVSQRVRAETRLDLLDMWFDDAILATDEPARLRLVERILRTPLPKTE